MEAHSLCAQQTIGNSFLLKYMLVDGKQWLVLAFRSSFFSKMVFTLTFLLSIFSAFTKGENLDRFEYKSLYVSFFHLFRD